MPYKPATHRQAHQSLSLSLSLSKTEGCALQTYSARAVLSPDTANVPTPFVGESPWPSLITPAKTKESLLHHQKNIQDLEFPACSQQRLCHHHSQLSITRTQNHRPKHFFQQRQVSQTSRRNPLKHLLSDHPYQTSAELCTTRTIRPQSKHITRDTEKENLPTLQNLRCYSIPTANCSHQRCTLRCLKNKPSIMPRHERQQKSKTIHASERAKPWRNVMSIGLQKFFGVLRET